MRTPYEEIWEDFKQHMENNNKTSWGKKELVLKDKDTPKQSLLQPL